MLFTAGEQLISSKTKLLSEDKENMTILAISEGFIEQFLSGAGRKAKLLKKRTIDHARIN